MGVLVSIQNGHLNGLLVVKLNGSNLIVVLEIVIVEFWTKLPIGKHSMPLGFNQALSMNICSKI
jgi:hypothetical protein